MTKIYAWRLFQFEQKISELGNKIKNVYDEAINLLKENLHTFRLYAEGNIIFDYINAAAGNVYERVSKLTRIYRATDTIVKRKGAVTWH